jgi:adenylosuccinate lyase
LLLDLAEAGMSREDAYKLVQTHAMNAWQNDLNFRSLVEADPAITAKLSPQKAGRRVRLPSPVHQHRCSLRPRSGRG